MIGGITQQRLVSRKEWPLCMTESYARAFAAFGGMKRQLGFPNPTPARDCTIERSESPAPQSLNGTIT